MFKGGKGKKMHLLKGKRVIVWSSRRNKTEEKEKTKGEKRFQKKGRSRGGNMRRKKSSRDACFCSPEKAPEKRKGVRGANAPRKKGDSLSRLGEESRPLRDSMHGKPTITRNQGNGESKKGEEEVVDRIEGPQSVVFGGKKT